MERLWAPWRKHYVVVKKKMSVCIFCRALRAPRRQDPKNLVLYRSRFGFIILNLYPYNSGHLMVVPKRHVATLEKLNRAERLDFLKLHDLALQILRKALRPQGFNLGLNLSRSGGAGVLNHLHLHIVPRWMGDTNFMPVMTGTKVISDSLDGTYQRLRRFLKK